MNSFARWFLILTPVLAALGVWLSPLAFVPVPWPDDSAFYFVARDFFRWPPRWVMIPQSPFEPTYRIFNFNTMPLYPLLIGLGRFVGIDGSFALKFWPLAAWALSGSLLAAVLLKRAKLPVLLTSLVILAISLDPVLRWASVLIRPESLIGLAGMALVLGLTFGFPARLRARGWWWDPVSALLAIAAYAHFNAVHLLFPVIAVLIWNPKRLVSIGLKTALYLVPWIITVLWHFPLFVHQMNTQWARLSIQNNWLSSVNQILKALIPDMGSPTPWAMPAMLWAAWILGIFLVLAAGALLFEAARKWRNKERADELPNGIDLTASAAWALGAVWLWHTKPEVWFVYFIHLSAWCFCGLALARVRRNKTALTFLAGLALLSTFAYAWADAEQMRLLSRGSSWRWSTYDEFVSCIDERLVAHEKSVGAKAKDGTFRVWGPTFPDVLIELSRRHPDWEFTRTNDFWSRANLAIAHGREVDAVVVTETLRQEERTISAPAKDHPELTSVWMNWKDYFLNRLWTEADWKQDRHICQRGRWQAFLFMDPR